jgi:hypothetical protein
VRAARMQAAQAAAAAAARQLGARRGGLFQGMDLQELQNIMMEARLHEDHRRERGLSAEGKAALVHFTFSCQKSAPAPSPSPSTMVEARAGGGGGGFGDGVVVEEEPMEALTVSRQSSSSLSLAASTKQPSGVWLGGEGEEGEVSEGREPAVVSGSKEKEGEEVEAQGGDGKRGKQAPGVPSLHPADALIDTQCSICLCDYEEGDSLTLLPACRHTFHAACIDVWLAQHVRCPLCLFDYSRYSSTHSVSAAATPMAPRRRATSYVVEEGDSDSEDDASEEEEEEEEDEDVEQPRQERSRRVMTIVNEPTGRAGVAGGHIGTGHHPVMRIVAMEVREEGGV